MRYYSALNCKNSPRIVLAVTNDLVADRRVARHAEALREAGYAVATVGRNDLKVKARRGWRFYLEYNVRLRRCLLREKPDIVWANDTDTLLGAWLASRRLHCKLVMDAHELFPEVPEIQHKPLVKWVWRTIERRLMPKCDALLTVCQSLTDHYKTKYGVEMTVVRNLPSPEFPNHDIHPHLQTPTSNPRTLLYQGCVNLGRGVDWAVDALEWLPDCRLVVAGRGDLLEQMKAYAAQKPWADRVTFLGHVPPSELPDLTRQADVGLVMLEDMGLSYHYALPNRIGDFVQAGVPMVVSDLPEMAAVVRRFGVGDIMSAPGAKALAESVTRVLSRQWTADDFSAARADMDWNKEKQKLINIPNNLKQCCTTSC